MQDFSEYQLLGLVVFGAVGFIVLLWLSRRCEAQCGEALLSLRVLTAASIVACLTGSVVDAGIRRPLYQGDVVSMWVVLAVAVGVALVIAAHSYRAMGPMYGTIRNVLLIVVAPAFVVLGVLLLAALLFGLIVFGAMSQPPVQTRSVNRYSSLGSTW